MIRIFRADATAPDPSTPTVQEVCDLYLQHRAARGEKRADGDRKHVLAVFCRSFGPRAVVDLCPDDLEDWIARQETLKSAWSRRRWCATVNAAFNWAHRKKRVIPYNPLAGVSIRPGKRGRPLTDREFSAIIREATDKRFRRLMLFLRYCGCRPGEAASAKWTDLDLDRGVIVLEHHKTEHSTGEPRTIYLPPQAVRLLSLIAKTDKADSLIFVNAWGRKWGNSALSQRMQGIRARAGIPKDAKIYGNRHRYATDAITRGVDIATLAELLGHKGTRTTSHYVHLSGKDKHLSAAVRKATGH